MYIVLSIKKKPIQRISNKTVSRKGQFILLLKNSKTKNYHHIVANYNKRNTKYKLKKETHPHKFDTKEEEMKKENKRKEKSENYITSNNINKPFFIFNLTIRPNIQNISE